MNKSNVTLIKHFIKNNKLEILKLTVDLTSIIFLT